MITDPGRNLEASWRLPAVELEQLILKQMGEFLADQNRIWALCKEAGLSHHESAFAMKRAKTLGRGLRGEPNSAVRPFLLVAMKRIVVHADRIVMELSRAGFLKLLAHGDEGEWCAEKDEGTVVLTIPCQFRRRGSEMRLVIGNQASEEGRPDAALLAAVVRAHAWWRELCSGNASSIKQIADREHSDERYVARNLKLAFLAPDITGAILEGRQPAKLTADGLIKIPDLPPSWTIIAGVFPAKAEVERDKIPVRERSFAESGTTPRGPSIATSP